MTFSPAPDNRTNIARILYSFDDFLRYLHSHWIKDHTTLEEYGYFADGDGFIEEIDYDIDDVFKQEDQYLIEGAHAVSASAWAAQSHFCFGRLTSPVPLLVDGGPWLRWYLNDVGIEISLAGVKGYCLLHEVFFEVTVRNGLDRRMHRLEQTQIFAGRVKALTKDGHKKETKRAKVESLCRRMLLI